MKQFFKELWSKIRGFLAGLSFRTGVIVLIICVLFYILSFAQALLPISTAAKGTLWVVLFGMAKLTQYTGLLIVGAEGWRRIKGYFQRKKSEE